MGVLGLWKLIDASGHPVPLETLEGKVLAIDVSIWIHQVIQGYQDRRGSMLPNAHLIGLFNRICKLLYFKIKPVFVFDGGVPLLKKNTIAARRRLKSFATSKAQKLKNDLINNLIKHTVVKGALEKGNDGESSSSSQLQKSDSGVSSSSSKSFDIFKLPEMPSTSSLNDSEEYYYTTSEDDLSPKKQSKWSGNIHSINLDTDEFKSLPADVRYDILTDLKETRKQSSWGKVHEMPVGSNNYASFQMKRLLKRRHVQDSLEKAEKEMGGKTFTLEELDKLLTEQGITTTIQDDAFRIASDSTTRVVYINEQKNPKQDKKCENISTIPQEDTSDSNDTVLDAESVTFENSSALIDNLDDYDLDEFWESDDDFNDTYKTVKPNITRGDEISTSDMNPALNYMLEYSGLTRDQILKLIEQSKKNKKKSDDNSSKGSTKRSKTMVSKRKNKKKKLSESSFKTDKPKSDKDIFNETTKVATIEVSSSDYDDCDQVSEKLNKESKRATVSKGPKLLGINRLSTSNFANNSRKMETSSESDSDFVEVEDVPIPEEIKQSNKIEVTVQPLDVLENDIFSDVFSDPAVDHKKENLSDVDAPQLKIIGEKSVLHDNLDNTLKNDNDFKNNDEKSVPDENLENTLKIFKEEKQIVVNDTTVLPGTEHESEMQIKESKEKLRFGILSKNEDDFVNPDKNSLTLETKDNLDSTEEEKDKNSVLNDNLAQHNVVQLNQEITESDDDIQVNMNQNVEQQDQPLKIVSQHTHLPADQKELESMKEKLETEQREINGVLGKLERQAADITEQMRIEAQELLRLFGLPYVVAPMEAEAQCAYLEKIKLTDGTITDDSDVWLFGGNCVYKNFFDNNKRVLRFLASDIEHHFNLTKEDMILLALLVGSDYTNGLAGVGPVTALEIMAAFPYKGENMLVGLRNFCTWFGKGKLTAPDKISLRNKLKNVQIEKGFPSQAVVQAYLNPTIDDSKEPFTWGKPNLTLLTDYVRKKFGWTKLKFEETMNPVMKKLNEVQSQSSISSYFKVHTVPRSIEATLSKRVQSAVQKLGGKISHDNEQQSTSGENLKKLKKVRKPGNGSKQTKKQNKKTDGDNQNLAAISEEDEEESKDNEFEDIEESKLIAAIDAEGKASSSEPKETKKKANLSARIKTLHEKQIHEIIPQRERDRNNALKTKLRAIEVFRKSNVERKPQRSKRTRKAVKEIKKDAELSESSSSS